MDSVPTIVARSIDAYNRMNVQAMLDCLSGDVRFINRSNGEMTNETHGIEDGLFIARLGASIEHEALRIGPHRQDHASAERKLIQQRLRYMIRRGGDHDGIERSLFRPSIVAVPCTGKDILISQACQQGSGLFGERFDDFNRVHL